MADQGGEKPRRKKKRKKKKSTKAQGALQDALSEMAAEQQRRGTGQYEFRRHHDEVFRMLSSKMGMLATLGYIGCAAASVQGIILFTMVIGAKSRSVDASAMFAVLFVFVFVAIALFTATWIGRAARSFRAIVDTEGEDIDHLMSAMRNLEKLFTLQATLAAFGTLGAVVSTLWTFTLL